MRFVEDRQLDARQQLGDAAVAQRHVGEEEMVVDDDDVGEHRLAPRLHDVALAVLRALAAEAVLARRGDQRDHAAALVEALELGDVAARGRLRPGLDLGQRAHREAIGQVRVVARLAESMQAEIARPALQQRHRQRQLERIAQARQVANEELVLERLGGGAEQRARAAQERRDEIGVGLADAGAGLDDERARCPRSPRRRRAPSPAARRARRDADRSPRARRRPTARARPRAASALDGGRDAAPATVMPADAGRARLRCA